jgi:hypothetical protein
MEEKDCWNYLESVVAHLKRVMTGGGGKVGWWWERM